MPKKSIATVACTQQDQYALYREKAMALQTLQRNKAKMHVFSSQLSRLIDAIPDAILLKNREGRKLVTDQLTKRFFKLHDLNWYGRTDISPHLPAQQKISANPQPWPTLQSELNMALEKRQLRLYYQAQVNGAGQMLGAEVLLRWEHPHYGRMHPDRLIPLAEQAGLILPIGAWVLKTACEQLKLWQSDPLN
jgi:hypothetical protein